MLPQYLAKATPNPAANRLPWYVNTAPSYAGVFLWIAFYQLIAKGTLDHASLGVCLAGALIAGLLSYTLYYYVPGMLGMQTGFPLYVVGSSTFGTTGGYLMPGLLMGLLQIGWFAVGTFFSTQFILKGLHQDATPNTPMFWIVAALWTYSMAWVGVKGIQYVSKVSLYLNCIPLLMLLFVVFKTGGAAGSYNPPAPNPFVGFTTVIAIVIGFFATAGAAGTDFGMNSRDERDVRLGGFVGVTLASLFAAGLPLISVAGARVLTQNASLTDYGDVISFAGGPSISSIIFFLFALASITPACFCAFIAGNSFSTMIPGVPRIGSTMAGVTVALLLAATGAAADLIGFFTIVGASFGPICGAMVADYLLSGKRWAGPREGINLAGYGAWALGFLVGLLPFLPISDSLKPYTQPAVLYSFFTGLIVYAVLAKMGLEPKTISLTEASAPVRTSSSAAKKAKAR